MSTKFMLVQKTLYHNKVLGNLQSSLKLMLNYTLLSNELKRPLTHFRDFATSTNRLNIREEKLSKNILLINDDPAQNKPLVVLLGWGNGPMKQLRKYSKLFEAKDFTCVCVTSTMINSIVRFDTAGRKDSNIMKNAVLNLTSKNKDRPIIFHTFSNGGLVLLYYFIKGLDGKSYPSKNIKGTIFDSCPTVPRKDTTEVVAKELTVNISNGMIKNAVGSFIKAFIYFLLATKKEMGEFVPILESSKLENSQLVLFSKADVYAPYKDILKYIEAREKKGVDITYKLWDDSAHVAHMKTNEEEYVKLVEEFVDKCLQ